MLSKNPEPERQRDVESEAELERGSTISPIQMK
jgi:hypothetical protein